MQPWEIIGRASAPDGTEMVLARRGDEWVVRLGGRVVMSSRRHGSEEALAALALERVARPRTVLVGGLGLGFTLRAALDRVPIDARVVVAELVSALVAWNRGPLAPLAGRPLEDPRVRLQMGDVMGRIAESRGAFDAILLDVDNGPSSTFQAANERIYGPSGIRACHDALAEGGVLAVWSVGPDDRYLARLRRGGFDAEAKPVPVRGESGGGKHVIFLAVKRIATRGGTAQAAATPERRSPRGRTVSRATRATRRRRRW